MKTVLPSLLDLLPALLTGGTGVFVMPAVPWIQSTRQKDELVQALGISFTFSTTALALGLWCFNAAASSRLVCRLWPIVPAADWPMDGTRVRRVISPLVF